MNWHHFFYFSKGERRALTLLLCLITVSWILLLWTEKRRKAYTPYPRAEKYAPGTLVELNSADTTILKKVPGIGSTFARRILKYRELLGGFYDIGQLAEVYGIDKERYQSLAPWFIADTLHIRRLEVNTLPAAILRKHPYLDYRQAKAIEQLRKQKSRLSGWENLQLLEELASLRAGFETSKPNVWLCSMFY